MRPVDISHLVDKLGTIKAEVARMSLKERTLREKLIRILRVPHGRSKRALGSLFQAVVSRYDAYQLDRELLESELGDLKPYTKRVRKIDVNVRARVREARGELLVKRARRAA